MKKEIINAKLTIMRGEHVIVLEKDGEILSQQVLIQFLRKGINNEKVKACTPRYESGHTIYSFKLFNEIGEFDSYLNVKVKNSEKHLHHRTIDSIKDLSKQSETIKKYNRSRFVAGVLAGTILFTLAAPALAKGLNKILEKEDKIYESQRPKTSFTITEEQKQQAEDEYYEYLKARAENGDEEAKREYEIYLAMDFLKQQNEAQNIKAR